MPSRVADKFQSLVSVQMLQLKSALDAACLLRSPRMGYCKYTVGDKLSQLRVFVVDFV